MRSVHVRTGSVTEVERYVRSVNCRSLAPFIARFQDHWGLVWFHVIGAAILTLPQLFIGGDNTVCAAWSAFNMAGTENLGCASKTYIALLIGLSTLWLTIFAMPTGTASDEISTSLEAESQGSSDGWPHGPFRRLFCYLDGHFGVSRTPLHVGWPAGRLIASSHRGSNPLRWRHDRRRPAHSKIPRRQGTIRPPRRTSYCCRRSSVVHTDHAAYGQTDVCPHDKLRRAGLAHRQDGWIQIPAASSGDRTILACDPRCSSRALEQYLRFSSPARSLPDQLLR